VHFQEPQPWQIIVSVGQDDGQERKVQGRELVADRMYNGDVQSREATERWESEADLEWEHDVARDDECVQEREIVNAFCEFPLTLDFDCARVCGEPWSGTRGRVWSVDDDVVKFDVDAVEWGDVMARTPVGMNEPGQF